MPSGLREMGGRRDGSQGVTMGYSGDVLGRVLGKVGNGVAIWEGVLSWG